MVGTRKQRGPGPIANWGQSEERAVVRLTETPSRTRGTADAGEPAARSLGDGRHIEPSTRLLERNGNPGQVYTSGMKLLLVFGLLGVVSGAVTGGGCSKTGSGFSVDAATSSDSASGAGGILAGGGSGGGGTAGNSGAGGRGGAVSGGTGSGGAGSGGAGLGGNSSGGATSGGAGSGGAGLGGNSSGGATSGGARMGGSGSGGLGGGGAGGKVVGGTTASGGSPNGGSGPDGGIGAGGTGGPVCPGVTPWPSGYTLCRSLSDCPYTYYPWSCQESPPATTGSSCGPTYCVYPPPQRLCTVDADCGSGKVCLSQPTSDCCPEPSFVCAPACTATSCPADQRCGTSGRCEPTPCSAGFVCPSGTLCAATRAGADSHGCATMVCTEGYSCPSDSRCQAGADNYHGCVPVRCTEGYTCPSDKRCQADASSADSHGCVFALCPDVPCPINNECQPSQWNSDVHGCAPKTCSTDSDCDCGACIRLGTGSKGQCAGRPYVCVFNSAGGAQAAAMGGSGVGGMGGGGIGGYAAAGGAGGGVGTSSIGGPDASADKSSPISLEAGVANPNLVTCGTTPCTVGSQVCCETATGSPTCISVDGGLVGCPGGNVLACDEPADCPTGERCYTTSNAPLGTACAATSGGFALCKTDSDCLTGTCVTQTCFSGGAGQIVISTCGPDAWCTAHP